jgi:hypothetical protein
MIIDGAENEDIMAAVREQFPTNHTNLNCVNWYRGALKKWPDNFGRPPSKKAVIEDLDEQDVEEQDITMTTEYSE